MYGTSFRFENRQGRLSSCGTALPRRHSGVKVAPLVPQLSPNPWTSRLNGNTEGVAGADHGFVSGAVLM